MSATKSGAPITTADRVQTALWRELVRKARVIAGLTGEGIAEVLERHLVGIHQEYLELVTTEARELGGEA